MAYAAEIAAFLDHLLEATGAPDYPGALNGLQLQHRGPVRRIAAAVDFSRRTVEATIASGANFLIVHHGMFWGGSRRMVGGFYERIRPLFEHDVAVYASHLPLDASLTLGNNALLARELGLVPASRFGAYDGTPVGVAGDADIATSVLLERVDRFARSLGGQARSSHVDDERFTRRWAIITGAGVGSPEIADAEARGIDTLVVGEGPHHTTVDAPEAGVVIIYAGHYATETLGVRAIAERAGEEFQLPTEFLFLPTGS